MIAEGIPQAIEWLKEQNSRSSLLEFPGVGGANERSARHSERRKGLSKLRRSFAALRMTFSI